jgi:hypothetical protein
LLAELEAAGIDAIAACKAAVIVGSGAVSQGEGGPGTGTDEVLGAKVTACDVDDVDGVGSIVAVACTMRCNVTKVN